MSCHIIDLPFALDALEPNISARTVDFHYNQHHKGYANNLERLIVGTKYSDMLLEEIIQISHASNDFLVYNNAAQVWNHNFYWQSICPAKDFKKPLGEKFLSAISSTGGLDVLVEEMVKVAMSQFASGWAWLVVNKNGNLEVRKTSNADPVWLNSSDKALLVVDVWEHAYYLDCQNRRAEYLKNFANMIHWSFAQSRFDVNQ